MFATLKRSRKFYDVEIGTRPHPILIIAECAKTSQPMQFDQTIFLATSKKSLARETKLYSRPSVIRTSMIRNSEADENDWFKVQEIIITSSFIIISARSIYTFINYPRRACASKGLRDRSIRSCPFIYY